MVRLILFTLSLLALGISVFAVPAPQFNQVTKSVAAIVVPTSTPIQGEQPLTLTAAGAPSATSSSADASKTTKIDIPNSAIDAAPVQNGQAVNMALISIPGSSNSTLIEARPDLQNHVNTALVNTTLTTKAKRGLGFGSDPLGKRGPSPTDCNPSTTAPELTVDTWQKVASKICKIWYPDPSTFQYDPSAPLPAALKSTTLGPINVGNDVIVTLEFSYGVDDWGTQAGAGWQKFYVPQSQSICIADLWTLINDMNSGTCLYLSGYDTSGDFTGAYQPKWYTFTVS